MIAMLTGGGDSWRSQEKRNWLVRPPFSEHPPLALSFDAPSIGLMFAVWSLLALIGQSISLSEMATTLSQYHWWALQSATGNLALDCDAGLVVGAILSLAGGLLMFRRRCGGKGLVISGLTLGIVCQIAYMVPFHVTGIWLVGQATGIAVLALFCLGGGE
jgi:hypothetical protein